MTHPDGPVTYVNREQHPHLWSFFQVVAATILTDEDVVPLDGDGIVMRCEPIEAEEFDRELASWTVQSFVTFAGVLVGEPSSHSAASAESLAFDELLETAVGRAIYEVLEPGA